jgi:hypothetical protein
MTNKQFDERAQGFNFQLGRLKANAKDAGITIGTALLPKITPAGVRDQQGLRRPWRRQQAPSRTTRARR